MIRTSIPAGPSCSFAAALLLLLPICLPAGYPLTELLKHGANYCYPINGSITSAAPTPEAPSAAGPTSSASSVRAPIQQGLADLDPDVVGSRSSSWLQARLASLLPAATGAPSRCALICSGFSAVCAHAPISGQTSDLAVIWQ